MSMYSCNFWWLNLKSDHNGLMEIKSDSDALLMASSVDYAWVKYMYARESKADVNASSNNGS